MFAFFWSCSLFCDYATCWVFFLNLGINEISEDVYTAFKNVLAHASDTAPIVTVLVTKTDIILNTTDLTGDYALVYSPDRNPEKNAINCDYTKKAGNGWYHIWYS